MHEENGGVFTLAKCGRIALNYIPGYIRIDDIYLSDIIREQFPDRPEFAGELLLTIRSRETPLEIQNTLTGRGEGAKNEAL